MNSLKRHLLSLLFLLFGTAGLQAQITWSLSPNPFQREINLIVHHLHGETVQLDIYDPAGRFILTPIESKHLWGPQLFVFDLDTLPDGLYLVFLTVDGKKHIGKIFKGAVPVSMEEKTSAEEELQIFPNPASSQATVSMGGKVMDSYSLLSMDGQDVSQGVIRKKQFSLPLGSVASGTYLLRVQVGGASFYQKLIRD